MPRLSIHDRAGDILGHRFGVRNKTVGVVEGAWRLTGGVCSQDRGSRG